jgi:hypothetical protein
VRDVLTSRQIFDTDWMAQHQPTHQPITRTAQQRFHSPQRSLLLVLDPYLGVRPLFDRCHKKYNLFTQSNDLTISLQGITPRRLVKLCIILRVGSRRFYSNVPDAFYFLIDSLFKSSHDHQAQ